MKCIPLTRGKIAIVDDRFYRQLLSMGEWYAQKIDKQWYAASKPHGNMHRVVVRLATGLSPPRVDHKDGDGLNNRHRNLRPATHRQNEMNRGVNKNNTSGFKGVWRRKDTGKWAASIRVHGRTHHLGSYVTTREAAKAYNKAAKQHFGRFAWLNPI